ncbi:MAG: hypothetical protein HWE23_12040 [Rhodobacteraceae bacterium]|nr:hypothetical protein [Paracoccaceae bacterium]
MAVGKNSEYCEEVIAGPLSATIDGDRIHTVKWYGLEVLRGVSAPVRDKNWGTVREVNINRTLSEQNGVFLYRRSYLLSDGMGEGRLTASFDPAGVVTIDWSLSAHEDISINRAGLCVLHPLKGVEGTPLVITEPDGERLKAEFPAMIAPAQPAKNIRALQHEIFGTSVTIEFEGEVFEMEDQRNWSDASYKTYCRPLSSPKPFKIGKNEHLNQRITIHLKGRPDAGLQSCARPTNVRMPEILLAVEPGWQETVPAGCARLARFGRNEWSDRELLQLDDAPFDAEFAIPDDAEPQEFLARWAQRLEGKKLQPRHIIALPEAYLKSFQPDGDWPSGPTPNACIAAARSVFPEAKIGAGMLTNFTEFNRRPPTEDNSDYVTHGNSAIVHAADDVSVLQTLEGLSAIFRSARALGGSKPYRLGLVSIGMRSNPYGAELLPNPRHEKRTMTDTDPRQTSEFAATYAIAATALAAADGAEAICLAAPAGPFSLQGPLEKAIAVLANLSGQEATITQNAGQFIIETADTVVMANAASAAWNLEQGSPLETACWRHMPAGGAA